jgi:hypothetical protein
VSLANGISTITTVRRRDSLVASTIIILLFILGATGSAVRKPVTQGFDEVAHVSYVAYLQTVHPLWPQLEQMRLIDPVTFKFTAEANYLNHPPFYYWLIAALGPEVREQPASLIYLRLLNVAIGAIGLIGLLALATRMELQGLEFYAFAVATASAPVLVALAGSVNNDNLGFAGGAFTILGAYEYVASQRRSWLIISCCGMMIAAASKLTGLMLSGGFLAALLVLMTMKRPANKIDIAIVAVSLIAAAAPYIVFALQYGSPAPNTPAQIDLLRNGANVAGWDTEPRMGPVDYTIVFLKKFLLEWMPSLRPRNSLQQALLIFPGVTVVLAALGAMLSLRSFLTGRSENSDPIVLAGILATIATLAIHIMFSYQRHLQTGWMMDTYPRYYLPVIAIIPMAAITFANAIQSSRARTGILSFLIAGSLIFGVFGAPID